jgi:hypothetical protein
VSIHELVNEGSGYERGFLEALGIETPCCVSCAQDSEYSPLPFVAYRADNGVWVGVETCCVHQDAIRDGLSAAGYEAR